MSYRALSAACGVACVAALGSACGSDVRLGVDLDAGVDGTVDGPGSNNPFAPGMYMMRFLDPAITFCDGSLTGMEAAFDSLTRADLQLVDGTITLEVPADSRIRIGGAPISTGWGVPALDLTPSPEALPLWDAAIMGEFGTGPLGTERDGVALAADSTTGKSSTIEAQVAALFVTGDGQGACNVGFATALMKL